MTSVLIEFEDFFSKEEYLQKAQEGADEAGITLPQFVVKQSEHLFDYKEESGASYDDKLQDRLDSLNAGRAATALQKVGHHKVRDVLELMPDEIEAAPGAGPKSARKLAETLEEEGYIDDADNLYPEEEEDEEKEENTSEDDTEKEEASEDSEEEETSEDPEEEETSEESEEETEEEDTEEESDEDTSEATDLRPDILDRIDNTSADKESVKSVIAPLKEVMIDAGIDEDDAKKAIKKKMFDNNFGKESADMEACLEDFKTLVPMTEAQRSEIMKLGGDLELDDKEVKVERPSATFGKPLEKLSAAEASQLIDNLNDELDEALNESFDGSDDIFDNI